MKKKILIIVPIILLLVILGVVYYFNTVFLPQKLKQIVNEKGQELLYRKISYDSIKYSFGKGIRITGLRIAQKDNPKKTLFTAKEISAPIPLLPLIRERKIILPVIVVKDFSANLSRIAPGDWSISDLFAARTPSAQKGFDVLLGKVSLQKGKIHLWDQKNTFAPIDLVIEKTDARLSLPKKIHAEFIGSIPETKTSLNLKIDHLLADHGTLISGQVSNLDLVQRVFPFIQKKMPFQKAFIRQADILAEIDNGKIDYSGDITADIAMTDGDLSASGTVHSRKMHLVFGQGPITAKADLLSLKNADIRYQDSLGFQGGAEIKQIAFSRKDGKTSLTGDISLTPKSMDFNDIVLNSQKIIANGFDFEQAPGTKTDDPSSPATTTLHTAFQATGLSTDLNGLKISCSLNSPRVQMDQANDGTITIRSPLSLSGVRLSQPSIGDITGDFQSDRIEIFKTKDALQVKGTAKSDQVSLALLNKRTGWITPTISFNVIKDFTKLDSLSYSMETNIENGELSNALPPNFDKLENIRGTVDVVNDDIRFQNLLFDTRKTTVAVNGELRTFSKFIADLDIEAKDLNIEDWLPLAQKYIEPYGLTIKGKSDISLTIENALIGPEPPKFTVKADFKGADISSSKYPLPLNNLQGRVTYKDNLVSWNNLDFSFKDQDFQSSGVVRDFQSPMVSAKLQGPLFFLTANMQYNLGEYDFSEVELKTKRSDVKGQGNFRFDNDDPYGDFHIEGGIALSDLKLINPVIRQKMDEWQALGEGRINLTFKGPLKRPLDATSFNVIYHSPYSSVKNLRFDNLTTQIYQTGPRKVSGHLTSTFYSGAISANADLDLEGNLPFKLQARGLNIDAAELLNDLPLKKQDISGTLGADIFLTGSAKETKKIIGNGSIEIKDGRFVKNNMLKGILAQILNPDSQNTVFTDAKTKFFVRNNKLKLRDIYLHSNTVDLTGLGTVDIDKNMDFTLTPSFKDSSSINPSLLKSTTQDILEKYMSVHIIGKPGALKYSVKINAGDVAGGVADAISSGVSGVMKGLGL